MRKAILILALALLLGAIAYTIRASVNREMRIIRVPEGTIIEVKEVLEDTVTSTSPISSDAEHVIVIETIEVPEGIITVRTEMIDPQAQSDNTSESASGDGVLDKIRMFEMVKQRLQRTE